MGDQDSVDRDSKLMPPPPYPPSRYRTDSANRYRHLSAPGRVQTRPNDSQSLLLNLLQDTNPSEDVNKVNASNRLSQPIDQKLTAADILKKPANIHFDSSKHIQATANLAKDPCKVNMVNSYITNPLDSSIKSSSAAQLPLSEHPDINLSGDLYKPANVVSNGVIQPTNSVSVRERLKRTLSTQASSAPEPTFPGLSKLNQTVSSLSSTNHYQNLHKTTNVVDSSFIPMEPPETLLRDLGYWKERDLKDLCRNNPALLACNPNIPGPLNPNLPQSSSNISTPSSSNSDSSGGSQASALSALSTMVEGYSGVSKPTTSFPPALLALLNVNENIGLHGYYPLKQNLPGSSQANANVSQQDVFKFLQANAAANSHWRPPAAPPIQELLKQRDTAQLPLAPDSNISGPSNKVAMTNGLCLPTDPFPPALWALLNQQASQTPSTLDGNSISPEGSQTSALSSMTMCNSFNGPGQPAGPLPPALLHLLNHQAAAQTSSTHDPNIPGPSNNNSSFPESSHASAISAMSNANNGRGQPVPPFTPAFLELFKVNLKDDLCISKFAFSAAIVLSDCCSVHPRAFKLEPKLDRKRSTKRQFVWLRPNHCSCANEFSRSLQGEHTI
ncbi:hypothetical protein L596_001726 [Steinernema carpocapsae]|uniref:Uncharacterized protein n=1 Tax=Steinernema carpocapsae TaxID=34508 RepID=A0A4U8UMB7_STECR|nr:hypothetical protein L596_001726 [Steinernema carpocapsae]